MDLYSRRQTSDDELLRTALLHAADERQCMSVLLADIAEIESRRLFAPAGYSSLFHYCTDALKLSDDAAQRRIHAARIARRFPSIYAMCADGRLSLTTVNLLAPRLTEVNADELLAPPPASPRATSRRWSRGWLLAPNRSAGCSRFP